jgi:hypothetical protein
LGYHYDTIDPECQIHKFKFVDDIKLKFRDDIKLKFADDPAQAGG